MRVDLQRRDIHHVIFAQQTIEDSKVDHGGEPKDVLGELDELQLEQGAFPLLDFDGDIVADADTEGFSKWATEHQSVLWHPDWRKSAVSWDVGLRVLWKTKQ